MKRYKIFADNLSTGVWDWYSGENTHLPDEFPEHFHIMLEQWHDIWEFVIDNGNMSGMYKEAWESNGKKIVDMLNKYSRNKHLGCKFTYVSQ